jgi:hypothetical protein
MKRMTAQNRSTMRGCNMWFPHNEIVAPYASINMLCLCSLSGKGFLVEVQAEEVLTGEQMNLWQQHCRGILHSELGVLEELWDTAVVEDCGTYLLHSAHYQAHIISWLGTLHLRRTQRMSMSLEVKFGTCVKAAWRNLYQIQMRKYYPINRTWKHENYGAHSCVKQDTKTLVPIQNFIRANTNTHHGINDTGNSNRHHCHKAQLEERKKWVIKRHATCDQR